MARLRSAWKGKRVRAAASLPAVMLALALGIASAAAAQERLTFGTDWRAQAEHGGFYQALATGLYAKRGLDVSIRQGGPQLNQTQLLAAGRLDFSMAPNSFIPLNAVKEGVPVVAVAAFFQKDPAVLIAHPGQGNDSFAALRGKSIMIAADTRASSWLFLKQRFGYSDAQIRPYAFSIAPFLADPGAIQQGYLGSEPFLIRKQGVTPVVLLLADAGYASYGALVLATARSIAKRPDFVRRFVEASAEGWRSYLDGDPAPAHVLIRAANPEMTDDLLTYGREQLIARGIVRSGDAERLGIGAMTDARWQAFFTTMAEGGLYPHDLDWRRAFTLAFAGRGGGN